MCGATTTERKGWAGQGTSVVSVRGKSLILFAVVKLRTIPEEFSDMEEIGAKESRPKAHINILQFPILKIILKNLGCGKM